MRLKARNAKNLERVIIKKFRSSRLGFNLLRVPSLRFLFFRGQENNLTPRPRYRDVALQNEKYLGLKSASGSLFIFLPSFLFHLMLGRHHRSAPEDSLPGDQGPPPRSYTMDSVDPWITDLSIKNSVCSVSYRLYSRCSLFRTPP